MRTLNDSNFQDILGESRAVIDFWNPSCPRCVSYKPTFESVAGQIGGDVVMATAMTDDAPKAAAQYGLSSIPTTVFLANGQLVGKVEGEMSAQDLMAEISKAFGQEVKAKPVLLRIVGGVVLAGLLAGAVYFIVKE